jgi:hypothetical protein
MIRNMSWLNGFVSKAVGSAPSQTIPALINRLQQASSSDERRKSLQDLKSLSEEDKHIKVCRFWASSSISAVDFISVFQFIS